MCREIIKLSPSFRYFKKSNYLPDYLVIVFDSTGLT